MQRFASTLLSIGWISFDCAEQLPFSIEDTADREWLKERRSSAEVAARLLLV